MAPRVDQWTGRHAAALQAALHASNQRFAEILEGNTRTVAEWHRRPEMVPKPFMQRMLDKALREAPAEVQERFADKIGTTDPAPTAPATSTADPAATRRLAEDPSIGAALDWLDSAARWSPGTARTRVAAQLAATDRHALEDRGRRRARVTQADLAWSLARYYGQCPPGYGRYGATCGAQQLATTVLTHPDCLDLAAPLLGDADRLTVTATAAPQTALDGPAADHAVTRIAEILALNVRMVDMPLYRLQQSDVHPGAVAGRLGVDQFARYALTLDLLEAELTDALATGAPAAAGTLPLRDRYLTDLQTVLDLDDRLCAGGTLALCAIARPADPRRGPADYVLLIQERSGHVLNAARRLAVIPKGFHQPITDYRTDAQLGATLLRETEEELFGRDDIDNTLGEERRADPMHPSWLSAPMRHLLDNDGLRIECTGFGLNLISGNYEFAGLLVIDDEQFWTQFGGLITANWEAAGLRQYSSLDRDLITELVADVAWSNEGLFAFMQGLRRLGEVGGDRVNVPSIDWELW